MTIDGANAPDSAGNVVVRTSTIPMLKNYRLTLDKVNVVNLDINHSFHFLDAGYHSLADDISITNSSFNKVSGDILKLNKEVDDLGIYNAEYVTLDNNSFANIKGAIAKIYRGGTDESTFGPHLSFKGNVVENVGNGKRNKEKASLLIHGVQVTLLANNKFVDAKPVVVNHTVGEPNTIIRDNFFSNTAAPMLEELNFPGPSTAKLSGNQVVTNDIEG